MPSYPAWPAGFPASSACQPESRRVCHGFELPFVFGSPVTILSPHRSQRFAVDHTFATLERQLSDAMQGAWASLAHRLDPNGHGLPPWPRFRETGARLVLGGTISETRDAGANCKSLWGPMHARLAGD